MCAVRIPTVAIRTLMARIPTVRFVTVRPIPTSLPTVGIPTMHRLTIPTVTARTLTARLATTGLPCVPTHTRRIPTTRLDNGTADVYSHVYTVTGRTATVCIPSSGTRRYGFLKSVSAPDRITVYTCGQGSLKGKGERRPRGKRLEAPRSVRGHQSPGFFDILVE